MANFVLLLDTSVLYFVLSQRCEARWVSPLAHSSSSMQNNAHDVCANTCTSHAERWRKGETIADSVLPAHPPSAKRHCFPSSFCSPLFFLVDEFSFQHGTGDYPDSCHLADTHRRKPPRTHPNTPRVASNQLSESIGQRARSLTNG